MIIQMKKALTDLATAHFTKNTLRVRNMQILIFFYKICVFALKRISITNQEIMQGILFDFPLWQFEVLFVSTLKTYAKFSSPFNTAIAVEETGPKMVFFGLGPTLSSLRSTKVGKIHLKLILTYTQLPTLVQQSILASLNFGL